MLLLDYVHYKLLWSIYSQADLFPPSLYIYVSAASSVNEEVLLNWMALLSGEIGISRRNFMANHLPRNCR